MANQYLKEVKKKLAKYDQMKDLIKLRRKDIELQRIQLENTQDQQNKERLIKSIEGLELEVSLLQKDITAIDTGVKRLHPVACKIIDLKYRRGETWVSVSLEVGYGQTRCKEIGREALILMKEYLYGMVANG